MRRSKVSKLGWPQPTPERRSWARFGAFLGLPVPGWLQRLDLPDHLEYLAVSLMEACGVAVVVTTTIWVMG